MKRSVLLATMLCCLISIVCVPLSYAQSIKVGIRVIKASNAGSELNPVLRDISSQLARLNYSSYKLIKQDSKTGQSGQSVQFSLPDGDQMNVQISGLDESFVNLKVILKQAGLKTNFKIVNGGTVIIGGNKFDDGTLVIALTASF